MSDSYSEVAAKDEKWFAVHTYSGYEEKCQKLIMQTASSQGLSEQILEVAIPMETVQDKRKQVGTDEDGNPIYETRERKKVPGYIFVKVVVTEETDPSNLEASQWKMGERAWYIIRNSRGITGFVGPAGVPYPLTHEECVKLGLISEEEVVEKSLPDVNYALGDFVVINEGYMMGQYGTVSNIDLENRIVTVEVNSIGTIFTVDVDINAVAAL